MVRAPITNGDLNFWRVFYLYLVSAFALGSILLALSTHVSTTVPPPHTIVFRYGTGNSHDSLRITSFFGSWTHFAVAHPGASGGPSHIYVNGELAATRNNSCGERQAPGLLTETCGGLTDDVTLQTTIRGLTGELMLSLSLSLFL